jgi:hypothetical protein
MKHLIAALVALLLTIGAFLTGQHTAAPAPQFGAVSSPDIPSPYFSVGGVRIWKYSMAPKQGSYTLCSFLSPAATSTLTSGGVNLAVSTTSASTLYLAKAATATATTTLLSSAIAVGAGTQIFVEASTSPAAGNPRVFAPNTYFNVAINPGTTTNLVPQGACHATFEEYQTL